MMLGSTPRSCGEEKTFSFSPTAWEQGYDARLDRESGVSAVGGRVVRVTRLLSLSVNRISKLTLSSMAMLMMSCAQ